MARIQQIEKDILRIRQLLQSQAAEAEVSEPSFVSGVYLLKKNNLNMLVGRIICRSW